MSEYELVNPDMMLSGGSLADERKFIMRPTLHKDGRASSAFDCPYDGTYCRQKDWRFTSWRDAVDYMATHKMNHIIVTSDSGNECPLTSEVQCIRKIRYENIIKQLKQNEK